MFWLWYMQITFFLSQSNIHMQYAPSYKTPMENDMENDFFFLLFLSSQFKSKKSKPMAIFGISIVALPQRTVW